MCNRRRSGETLKHTLVKMHPNHPQKQLLKRGMGLKEMAEPMIFQQKRLIFDDASAIWDEQGFYRAGMLLGGVVVIGSDDIVRLRKYMDILISKKVKLAVSTSKIRNTGPGDSTKKSHTSKTRIAE
ncbi:hypothetical protein G9A89_009429 [Geosiphon pyriformis]|nr:hypothetical protein G9A89_009429 [Geosiphon pyriformis]